MDIYLVWMQKVLLVEKAVCVPRIENRYERALMECREWGGSRGTGRKAHTRDMGARFFPTLLRFGLGSGVWKVVWSQQTFSGVLETELV